MWYIRCCQRSGELYMVSTCERCMRSRKRTRGLGKHSIVLKLRLPQRRSVASNDDKLGLASSQALEGRLVAKGDPTQVSLSLAILALLNVLARLHHKREARVDGVGGSLVLLGCHLCAQGVSVKSWGVVALRLSLWLIVENLRKSVRKWVNRRQDLH
jgi:hypothetical protein